LSKKFELFLQHGVLAHSLLWALCKYLAPDVKRVLEEFISTVERVSWTCGEADVSGSRTQFSHHSYGIALDINEAYNRLYENCIEHGSACVLRRDGAIILKALRHTVKSWLGLYGAARSQTSKRVLCPFPKRGINAIQGRAPLKKVFLCVQESTARRTAVYKVYMRILTRSYRGKVRF